MPYALQILPTLRLTLTRVDGTLSSDDLRRHELELQHAPDFVPDLRQLIDFRQLTSLEVTARDIRDAASAQPFTGGAMRVFVITTDELFGMARMYQILTEDTPHDLHLVRDIDEAFSLLGIEPESDRWEEVTDFLDGHVVRSA